MYVFLDTVYEGMNFITLVKDYSIPNADFPNEGQLVKELEECIAECTTMALMAPPVPYCMR